MVEVKDDVKKILLTQLQLCQKRCENSECYDSDVAAITKAMADISAVYASLCHTYMIGGNHR